MRLARLTQRKQFLAAADRGRRFRSSAFTVQVLDVSPAREAEGSDARDHDGLRLGLTASRKVGKAVQRNRIRRRLRVAAQLALAEQADRPCDVVIVARAETLTAGFRTLVGELSVAIERARPQGQGRKARPGKAGARIADTRPQSQSN
jgi:ribonuclease P protein component